MQQQLHSGLAALARHHHHHQNHIPLVGNNNDYYSSSSTSAAASSATKIKLEDNPEDNSMASAAAASNNGDLELSSRIRSRIAAAAAAAASGNSTATSDQSVANAAESGSESSSPAVTASSSTTMARASTSVNDSPIMMPSDSYLNSSTTETEQFKKDKSLIYRHPLFPLLGTMLEFCEIATQSPDGVNMRELEDEVKKFVTSLERESKVPTTDNQEVDELMIMAIRVLRIHLIELEKVGELCKDFCNRYIATIKPRMASENLLRSDYGGYDSDDSGGRASVGGAGNAAAVAGSSAAVHQMAAAAAVTQHHHPGGPHPPPPPHMMHAAAAAHHAALMGGHPYYHSAMHHNVSAISSSSTAGIVLNTTNSNISSLDTINSNKSHDFPHQYPPPAHHHLLDYGSPHHHHHHHLAAFLEDPYLSHYHHQHPQPTSPEYDQTPSFEDLKFAIPSAAPSPSPSSFECSSPESEDFRYSQHLQQHQLQQPFYEQSQSNTVNGNNNNNNNNNHSNNKRGVLPKHATRVMRSWLFRHIVHPYPSEDEKREMAHQTNLSLLQVNNWFINARRRILQPMLDASAANKSFLPAAAASQSAPKTVSTSSVRKRAKTNAGKPPVKRFWPESLQKMHVLESHAENDDIAS